MSAVNDDGLNWFQRWLGRNEEQEAKENQEYRQKINARFDEQIAPLQQRFDALATETAKAAVQDARNSGASLEALSNDNEWFRGVWGKLAEQDDVKTLMIDLQSAKKGKEEFNRSFVRRPVEGHGNNLWSQNDPDAVVRRFSQPFYYQAKREYNRYLNTDNFATIIKAELLRAIEEDKKKRAEDEVRRENNFLFKWWDNARNDYRLGTADRGAVNSVADSSYSWAHELFDADRGDGSTPKKWHFYGDFEHYQPRIWARSPEKESGRYLEKGQDRAEQEYTEDKFYSDLAVKIDGICANEQDRVLDDIEELEKDLSDASDGRKAKIQKKIQQKENYLVVLRERGEYAKNWLSEDLAANRANGRTGEWGHTSQSRRSDRGVGDHVENKAKWLWERAQEGMYRDRGAYLGLFGEESLNVPGLSSLRKDLVKYENQVRWLVSCVRSMDGRFQRSKQSMKDHASSVIPDFGEIDGAGDVLWEGVKSGYHLLGAAYDAAMSCMRRHDRNGLEKELAKAKARLNEAKERYWSLTRGEGKAAHEKKKAEYVAKLKQRRAGRKNRQLAEKMNASSLNGGGSGW